MPSGNTVPVPALLGGLRVGERPQPAQEGCAQDSAERGANGLVQEGEEQRLNQIEIHIPEIHALWFITATVKVGLVLTGL